MAYKTKQRELIIRFFETHHDESFSAAQIAEAIKEEGVSLSAIYRNLSDLEKDGRVRKVTKQGTHESFYQYMDCHDCRGHIHLHCVECGATTHLDEKESSALINNVLSSSSFTVDQGSTVLYGVCSDCAKHQHGEGHHE